MQTVEFEFGIKEEVLVTFAGVKCGRGAVTALWVDEDGVKQYYVKYIDAQDTARTQGGRAYEIQRV
jgi:hypothetical protein